MTAIIRYTINHKPLLMATAGVTGILLGKGCEWLSAHPQHRKINNLYGQRIAAGLEKVAGFAAPILDFVGKALIATGSVCALFKIDRNPKKVRARPPIVFHIRVNHFPQVRICTSSPFRPLPIHCFLPLRTQI